MLGDILRLIRIANDIKVKDAAISMDISSAYVSEVENNNKQVSFTILKKFSKLYDIPLSKIFLFEELQKDENLNNQQVLKIILEYYLFEKENNTQLSKQK